jgi:hypothetical protein
VWWSGRRNRSRSANWGLFLLLDLLGTRGLSCPGILSSCSSFMTLFQLPAFSSVPLFSVFLLDLHDNFLATCLFLGTSFLCCLLRKHRSGLTLLLVCEVGLPIFTASACAPASSEVLVATPVLADLLAGVGSEKIDGSECTGKYTEPSIFTERTATINPKV